MKKAVTLILLNIILISCVYAQENVHKGQNNFTNFTSDKIKITRELDSLTGSEYKTHPEYGILPFNAPCKDCIELLQKRDETHRYFVKEGTKGNQFYAQSSYGMLSYKDGSGILRTIDSRIKPTGQNGVFKAANQPFPLTINVPDKFTSLLNAGKELVANRNVTIFIKHINGSITSMGEPNRTDYTAGDNGLVFHNFYPGIDLELKVGNGHIESFYRFNKPQQFGDGWLVIRDNMKVPEGLVYDYSYSEKTGNNSFEGTLFINDHAGNHYFYIGTPAAYDENNEKDNELNLSYELADNNVYDLYIPIDWMNDAKRSYPLIIDPFISAVSTLPQASITGSGYNATCFQNGCTYNLAVTVPAASTVSEMTYSFNYRALGTCNLNRAAWDLTYKTCRSPSVSGTWHTCTIGLPGLCILQDLSCYADFQTCIPAPQCASYTIPMVLTFYRCVQSGAGCGFSCVNADTPWDMTVTGYRTVVSSTNASICLGASASLTATVDSGVAPYSYKWYPGGLTGNPVNVSPSTTTTYTVTASTCGGLDSAQAFSTVTVGPIIATAKPDTTVCSGSPVQLKGTGGTSFSWLPSTGINNDTISNPIATASVTTTYTLTSSSGSCHATATVTITAIPIVNNPPPAIRLDSIYPFQSPPYIITAGDSVSFNITATGIANDTLYLSASSTLLNGGYNASFPTPDSGVSSITKTFKYISSCNDANGATYKITFNASSAKPSVCSSASDTTYSVDITVAPPPGGLLDTIPNIFTPNGDHVNDSLSLYHEAIKSINCWTNFHIKIFSRWGELQYESTDIKFHWDGNNKSGNKVSDGVYFYIITADFLNKPVTKRGTVNVKL